MANDMSSTGALRVRRRRRRRKIKEAVDSISSLHDVILQHILSFIPTKVAITTSLLSKRWRHVWCDTPRLSFHSCKIEAASINETLTHYTSLKMMSFHLKTTKKHNIPHIDTWIKFAMSRNVENMSLDLCNRDSGVHNNNMPDFLNIISSSVKQPTLMLSPSYTMSPRCSVSWTSLQKLSLRCCGVSDESMTNILSGFPLLESLTLNFCDNLIKVLDLSKSMRLRALEIYEGAPTQIVAPHIHCLRFIMSHLPCSLVDVSSLAEAKLNINITSPHLEIMNAESLQVMVLKTLEELHNVDNLIFGEIFLQILSLAEVRGVPFPMLKVKCLTLKTSISQYVIPGIQRILQNSPDLNKLTVHTRLPEFTPDLSERYLDRYLTSQGLNPHTCWRSKDGTFWNRSRYIVEPKHVVSFMKLMLKNKKTLEKMVVLLEGYYTKFKVIIVSKLSHNNNVSIAVSTMRATLDDLSNIY